MFWSAFSLHPPVHDYATNYLRLGHNSLNTADLDWPLRMRMRISIFFRNFGDKNPKKIFLVQNASFIPEIEEIKNFQKIFIFNFSQKLVTMAIFGEKNPK